MKRVLLSVIIVLFSTSAFALPVIPSQATLSFSGELRHEGVVYDVHGSVVFNLIEISYEYNELHWNMELTATNKALSIIGFFCVQHDGDYFDWSGIEGHLNLVESVIPDYYVEGEDAWENPALDPDKELRGDFLSSGTDIFPRHIDLSFDSGGWDTEDAYFSADLFGQPVPEPATLLLLGTGILGVAGYRRKAKNTK